MAIEAIKSVKATSFRMSLNGQLCDRFVETQHGKYMLHSTVRTAHQVLDNSELNIFWGQSWERKQ